MNTNFPTVEPSPVKSPQDYAVAMQRVRATSPEIIPIKLKTKLPRRGRTDTPIVTTENMWVILKTYGSGGENDLHAHAHEDHMFFVLQGRAEFYGPTGKVTEAGQFGGVMLPKGALYYFKAIGDEPLVMLRIGAGENPFTQMHGRVDGRGNEFSAFSEKNKWEDGEEYYSDRIFESL